MIQAFEGRTSANEGGIKSLEQQVANAFAELKRDQAKFNDLDKELIAMDRRKVSQTVYEEDCHKLEAKLNELHAADDRQANAMKTIENWLEKY